LLNTDFAKTIRSSSEYDPINNKWFDSGVPILNFIDSDGNKQLQKWNDNTTVIPFDFVTSTPTPCPNF
jgi:regulatory protein YycH of two-component signal transduction system YycFG